MGRRDYAEKYKDPRWQKKRLEIMERDRWTCQMCFSEDDTLHVHHRFYRWGEDPWDHPDHSLVTLCEACHDAETPARKPAERLLVETVCGRLDADAVVQIAALFEKMLDEPVYGVMAVDALMELMDDDYRRGFLNTHIHRDQARVAKRTNA